MRQALLIAAAALLLPGLAACGQEEKASQEAATGTPAPVEPSLTVRTPTATPEWLDYYPNAYADPEEIDTGIADPTGSFFENRIALKFKLDVPKEEIAKILTAKNLKVVRYLHLSKVFLAEVEPDRREIILEQFKNDPNVEYAEKNYTIRLD